MTAEVHGSLAPPASALPSPTSSSSPQPTAKVLYPIALLQDMPVSARTSNAEMEAHMP